MCSVKIQNTAASEILNLVLKRTFLINNKETSFATINQIQSHWPRGLKGGSAADRFLGLLVRIQPGARMSVSFACCMSSVRALCVGLITRPGES
jgi:hypothetical protein